MARDGYDLILAARREGLLNSLADEIKSAYGVSAEIEVSDLTASEDISRLENRISETDSLTMLINNAGFNAYGRFSETSIERQLGMVLLHDIANLRLTWAALPAMLAAKRGGIINLASLTALIPWANNAVYGGSKAFLVNFVEALHQEIDGSGVRVQVLCPGFTRTEFTDVMGVDASGVPSLLWMEPEAVVEESLSALARGKVVVVPGLANRCLFAATRLVPASMRYKLTRFVVGRFDVR